MCKQSVVRGGQWQDGLMTADFQLCILCLGRLKLSFILTSFASSFFLSVQYKIVIIHSLLSQYQLHVLVPYHCSPMAVTVSHPVSHFAVLDTSVNNLCSYCQRL